MKFFILIIAIVSVESAAVGQSVPELFSARTAALAGANVALPHSNVEDINPSTTALDSAETIHFAATVTPFVSGLANSVGLTSGATYLISPLSTTVGIGFKRYSYESIFTDQTGLLSVTREFVLFGDRTAAAGLRLRYERLGFGATYASLSTSLLDLGLQFGLTRTIRLGFAASNLLSAKFSLPDGDVEQLLRTWHAGFAYSPTSGPIVLMAAVEASPGQTAIGRFAAEYEVEHVVTLRVGATSDPSTITGGVGIGYDRFRLDAATVYAPLGTTFSFGLDWKM